MANANNSPRTRNTNTNSGVVQHQQQLNALFDDTLVVKLASVTNAYRARKEAVDQKSSIARDIMSVSLTALGGAITLQIFAAHTVKTPLLFHIAAAGLLICVIGALIIRAIIAAGWGKSLNALGDMEQALRMAVGTMKFHTDEHHTQAVEGFEEALDMEPDEIENLHWLASMQSVVTLSGLFIISLVAIALSLLFKITVS